MADETYTTILKSYEENPKVQVLRKIRGKKALQAFATVNNAPADWISTWTDAEQRAARGFLYARRLRSTIEHGVKLVVARGDNISVVGHKVKEGDKGVFLRAFE